MGDPMNLNFIKPKTSTEEIEKLKEIAEEAQRLRKVSPNGINSWPDELNRWRGNYRPKR